MIATKPILRAVCLLGVLLISAGAQAQNLPDLGPLAERPTETVMDGKTTGADLAIPSAPSDSAASTSASAVTPLPAVESSTVKTEPAGARGEPVTERYPNGNIKIERHVMQDAAGNYLNQGAYTMYDLDGKILKTGEFMGGKLHGKWTQYFAKDDGHLFSGGTENQFSGPFVSEATFNNGKLDGTWIIKDRNGQNIIEWSFDRGVRTGKWTWWYSSGEKRLEANYHNGALNGEVLEWNRDGKVASQSTYIDGKYLAKVVGWHMVGQKHFDGYYLRAQSMSEPTYDWWTNTVTSSAPAPAGEDQKHGVWTSWYRNGNKKAEGQYDHGVMIGKFSWWYENGQKEAEGEYQTGQKSGVWTTWHANGLKESQGEYQTGKLVGKWLHWNADGKLVEARDNNTPSAPTMKKDKVTTGQRPVQYNRSSR